MPLVLEPINITRTQFPDLSSPGGVRRFFSVRYSIAEMGLKAGTGERFVLRTHDGYNDVYPVEEYTDEKAKAGIEANIRSLRALLEPYTK